MNMESPESGRFSVTPDEEANMSPEDLEKLKKKLIQANGRTTEDERDHATQETEEGLDQLLGAEKKGD